mmetsp:Transcript_35393/g.114015  ORF Transcript_35393/g.114015 Transcript_35393/m.114015 type:complete len:256 (+) Transcript_35393:1178-1945(+)
MQLPRGHEVGTVAHTLHQHTDRCRKDIRVIEREHLPHLERRPTQPAECPGQPLHVGLRHEQVGLLLASDGLPHRRRRRTRRQPQPQTSKVERPGGWVDGNPALGRALLLGRSRRGSRRVRRAVGGGRAGQTGRAQLWWRLCLVVHGEASPCRTADRAGGRGRAGLRRGLRRRGRRGRLGRRHRRGWPRMPGCAAASCVAIAGARLARRRPRDRRRRGWMPSDLRGEYLAGFGQLQHLPPHERSAAHKARDVAQHR